MRVLIVSPFRSTINPYIALFGEGLKAAGAEVYDTRKLQPGQLAATPRPDVIHLHWVEQYDRPPVVRPSSPFPAAFRSVERIGLRPLNAGPIYQLRRWRRLRALLVQLRAFQRAGGRVAFTVHNLDPHESSSSPERWALRQMIDDSDLLHVHDAATAGEIARRFGRRERVVVIPHGHYLSAYRNEVPRREARRRLGLPDDAFVYVCLGLMRPYKGLEELIPAFRGLAGERLRLVISGKPADAAYASHLRALAVDDPRVLIDPQFVPPDDVQVYLNAADIAVLPYRQITTSGAAILAFSFGLPVIAPAIGAFPNLVTEDRGILYAPGGLVGAMQEAQLTDRLSACGTIIGWVSQFDWEQIGRRLVAAYGGQP
jgi:beta-1,4-mannosyltransferase